MPCSRQRTARLRSTRTSTRSSRLADPVRRDDAALPGLAGGCDAIIGAMDKTIAQKTVTYDFARLMKGATEVKCSEFADQLIGNL